MRIIGKETLKVPAQLSASTKMTWRHGNSSLPDKTQLHVCNIVLIRPPPYITCTIKYTAVQ